MKKELDEKLVAKYPKIFRDRYAPMTHTAMCWGFECGDGWYNILDILCGNIQSHIDWSRKQRLSDLRFNRALKRALSGDSSTLVKYFTYKREGEIDAWATWAIKQATQAIDHGQYRVPRVAIRQVVASQVKEKFGTLRFYYNGGDYCIDGMVRMAESMSYRTCELCGAPGKANRHGWITTLCDTHRLERGETLPQDEDELESTN